jgi:phosphatidate cytidylyltransferase
MTIFIPVYAFLMLPAVTTFAGDTNEFLARNARVQWGLMLTVYSISHAPALLLLDTGVPAALLIVYLIIVVQLSDVFQYVWGKLIGRHRFSPNISPSKTLEGLIGGGLSAIAVGTLLHGMTPFTPLQAAAMSAVIVTAGFFGGFVLSAIKRDLRAKDWGTIIEGHGGVLDRVDSLTFAAPLFFHLTRYWFTS